jgi:hypothetical protein
MYKTISAVALAALTIICLGCSGDADASANAADTLTRRQKNEILSTIPYPGARGVGDALIATDRAAARARVHDSIAASH